MSPGHPLLPSLQAADLRRALTDYLATTFALTDDDVRTALSMFLGDPVGGIFRGPYARVRLPFRPAGSTWAVPLDWWPDGFVPYVHQAQAFERLSAKYGRPRPTLVTTGTGSGKTEAFLIPLVDHALRMRSAGQRGIKALVLYPMNALANDQAGRLSRLLTGDPRLAGLTAGLYTGEQQGQRTTVSPAGLITSRHVLRSDPPDILLTNYKMLDQLLLRGEDRGLWDGAAESLTYVVLDEFHTYDGAQGTDVAMLLRRLGSVLGVSRAGAPLGDVVPVATSATLGGGSDESLEQMRTFAETVFGCPFDTGSLVREERMPADEWTRGQTRPVAGAVPRPVPGVDVLAGVAREARAGGPHAVCDALLPALFDRDEEGRPLSGADVRRLRRTGRLPALLAGHPLTGRLLDGAGVPCSLPDLAARVLPEDSSPGQADGITVVEGLLGLLSQARASQTGDGAEGPAGRALPDIGVQLWVRQITRVDRSVSPVAAFRWSDDGAHADAELYLPALYCRHCGRSGWGAVRAVTGQAVDVSHAAIRAASQAGDTRFRAMLHAPGEATAAVLASPSEPGADPVGQDGLLWLDIASLELSPAPPVAGSPDESTHLPVLALWDDGRAAREQTCPSCRQADGIRFLGSSISTLTSVSLSALFGSAHLDPAEKKTLLFTDSVQDAAYTAGFVQSRSHALSLRAALLDTVAALGPISLADLPREAVERAGQDPARRYRLLPPALADWKGFRRFYELRGSQAEQTSSRRLVEQRLAFDVALELGLNARTGRTLELTGAVVVEVDTGTREAVLRAAQRALSRAREQHSLSPETDALLGAGLDDDRLIGWVRGVLERMRTRGGIGHPWLEPYLQQDGNRWMLSGGRGAARNQGLPAFPPGRPAPAFPTTPRPPAPLPRGRARAEQLDSLSGRGSWYSGWAQRQLHLTPRDGGPVTRALLDEAAAQGWLTTRHTQSGAVVYSLEPAQVTASASSAADLEAGRLALRCEVCRTLVPGSRRTVDDLAGAACLRAACPGTLHRAERGEDYYRELYASTDMRRVVAHEHTSLLPDKVRLAVEAEFRNGTGPAVPNVLTATPTLELGIDIGDLSTVMLGSLPRTVASYMQRAGRAGRLTGNSLVLAYVEGRGLNVRRIAEPLEVIDGEIRPPATYLDAIEILQRQFVAWLQDRRAGAGCADPKTAAQLFPDTGWAPGSWTGDLLAAAASDPAGLTAAFLALFGGAVRDDTAQALRDWAGVDAPEPQATGLARLLQRAAREYQREVDELVHRQNGLQDRLPELIAAAGRPTATDDDKRDARLAEAELRFVKARRTALSTQFWVAALEERGVLPNYSLLDDSVTLDVTLRWTDQETGEFREEQRGYQRGSALALTEWAPGATFYAQGSAIRIDAVDVGRGLDALLQTWRMCARCGWSRIHRNATGPEPDVPASCPRCGDPSVADTGQALAVLPLEKVSAQVSRDASAIGDARDERDRLRFTVVPAADVDPEQVTEAWRLRDYPFGAEYVRQLQVRWVNVGRSTAQGAERMLAGEQVSAPQFTLCPGCGVVPSAQPWVREVQEARHRAWCPHRTDLDVPWTEVSLGRTLTTQGVRVLIPPQFTLDEFAGPSFRAALLLGLRQLLGGDPDHLSVLEVHLPVEGQDRTAVLLHDRIPGGTGYLADLARPSRVRQMLTAALGILEGCGCADQEVLACPRCLLPFTPPGLVTRTSRAAAARMLGEILTSSEAAVDPDGNGGSEAEPWDVEQLRSIADIPLPSLESALELRFRRTFSDAMRARGVAVQEIPQLEGTELRLGVPGAVFRRWSLRPQVVLAGCKPDFQLLCEDPAVPPVAVFTDGRAYHAVPARNRVADDAAKRAALRNAGYLVWAVTDDDVRTFEALARGEQAVARGAGWYEGAVRQRLVGVRSKAIPAGSVPDALVVADAVSQLVDWVTDPRPGAWKALADGLPLALMADRPQRDFGRERLAELGRSMLLAATPPVADGDGADAWYWRQGPLVLTAAGRPKAPHDVGAVLLLNDADATLASDAGEQAWRCWLALSNVLGHATRIVQPLALSQPAVAPSAAPEPGVGAALPPQWSELVDTAASAAEAGLLRVLAAAGVPLPEQGYETDDGTPLDLAWPQNRIAVLLGADEETAAAASGEGWRVASDQEGLLALLTSEGAG